MPLIFLSDLVLLLMLYLHWTGQHLFEWWHFLLIIVLIRAEFICGKKTYLELIDYYKNNLISTVKVKCPDKMEPRNEAPNQ